MSDEQASAVLDKNHKPVPENLSVHERLVRSMRYLTTVGKPLVVGLAILATASGVLVYFLISAIWTLRVRWVRARRLRSRLQKSHPS
ncbi:MAG: DUF2062 domain-containing protein [Burkholderiaceae bacterium]